MAAVIISMALVMTAEIALRIYFGTKDRIGLLITLNKDMGDSISSGIKYPMSVGNSEAVMKVLSDIRARQEKIEVWICDFDQEITWSTYQEKIGTKIGNSLHNEDIVKALKETLISGKAPKKSFEAKVDGKRVLVTIQPILNHRDCYHCHGSSRKVLGNMVIGAYMRHTYATVAAARNRTLVISFIGISLIIALIYTMITKFLQRPVKDLVEASKKIAEGDMSVSVKVETEDEIGVLGNTFNYMVQRISSFSKALEQEVAKKSNLLNERTKLIGLLEKANIQLKELDKLKSMFLANMSHELRTPMNSIIGYSDLLIDGVDGPINVEQKKSLGKISNNAKHLLQLLNDLLDVSKIEARKIKIEPEKFDFREVIDSVLPIFEPMLKKKNLSVNIDIAEDLPPVYCDKDKI
ncbi:MAG: HAMP domain-containing protein, partial [Nitrospiraceae bacterium]|nr:HAMP domain-containing protein [Nitrospiraceae bacterium]